MGAVEIKLNIGEIPAAEENLNEFKDKSNTDKYVEFTFLMILMDSELSYAREYEIYVVFIGKLWN